MLDGASVGPIRISLMLDLMFRFAADVSVSVGVVESGELNNFSSIWPTVAE